MRLRSLRYLLLLLGLIWLPLSNANIIFASNELDVLCVNLHNDEVYGFTIDDNLKITFNGGNVIIDSHIEHEFACSFNDIDSINFDSYVSSGISNSPNSWDFEYSYDCKANMRVNIILNSFIINHYIWQIDSITFSQTQQKMYTHLNDGTRSEYSLGQIDSITFEEDIPLTPPATAEPIDLGLSVKWANFNLGAETDSGVGYLVGWGDITGKNHSTELKYFPVEEPTGHIVADKFDIAKMMWGGSWRLPTTREIKELINNCNWEWETVDGVGGYRVSGKNEGTGNIFLPVTGKRTGETVSDDMQGFYWSGMLDMSNDRHAMGLNLSESEKMVIALERYLGLAIRPVYGIYDVSEADFPVPEYVDLGLSVKWASWNIGASSDQEVGGYYGWGDNTGSLKSSYNSDYATGNTSTNIAGTNYDLAYVKWGGKWRMPTQAEYDELVSKCTWTFTRNYEGTGISGYIVNGKPGSGMENNSIFFPRAGYETFKGTKVYWNSDADYWTSECQEGNVKAYFVTLMGATLQNHTSDKNVMIPIRAIYAEATSGSSGSGSVDYSLSIQSGSGGSVTYNGWTITNETREFFVNSGSSATLKISPNSGYRLASLTVNGGNVTSNVNNNQYTISNITANTTVVATFERISTYSLSIQSGSGGSITYNGTTITNTTRSFTINEGTSATLTISSDSGYRLASLTVNGSNVTSSVSDNQYTISNITANTTVVATFETITYTVSVQAIGNGTVYFNSSSIKYSTKTFSVKPESSATISIFPDSGFRLASLVINGTDVTSNVSNDRYTISDFTDNTTIIATFEQIPGTTTYSLSIQSSSGGSISYDGLTVTNAIRSFTVAAGSSATITISPNGGCRLASLTVNGTNVTSSVSNNKYTISNISANTTVVASFEQKPTTYSLSIQSGSGGSVSYNGTTITNSSQSFTVSNGSSATITITPNSGYRLSSLTVNGTNVTSSVTNNKYTISNISANTTVVATFTQITYTLSVQASGNGTLTFGGTSIKNTTRTFAVYSGSSHTLAITLDTGYRLASLIVNGTNVTSSVSNNYYTISNISDNTTVVATFEQIPPSSYSLSIQSGNGGSVSYNGTTITNTTQSFTVSNGTSATITITPNSGYRLASLTVNGTNVTSSVTNNQYTINSITANTTVVATFEQITYILSVQASGNGTLTYEGTDDIKNTTRTFTVNHGSSVSLTVTPDTGYRLASLTVNGTNVTSSVSNNQYTINSITANTTVVATFEQINYSLSIQSGSGGSVSYNGTVITNTTKSFTITHGSSATITITPNSGYKLSSLTVNGTNVTSGVSNNQYTINSISVNTTVVVSFAENLQSFSAEGISYQMVSAANKTLNVNTGNYSGHVIIPASVSYEGETWSVRNAASGVFNNAAITAITWNPKYALSSNAFGSQTNPNLLLYVQSASYAPSNVQNVIADGNAKKIVLTDAASGNDFDCPESFTAEEISYTHKYTMTSGINECRGWETIALPFTVQKVMHQSKGQMVAFKQWDKNGDTKPYWLYKLSSTGFVEADFIEANTPYIISMPNNDVYYVDYNLSGSVTFSAQNATVKSSENLTTVISNGKTFKPCFTKKAKASFVYAVNAVNDLISEVGGYKEGSVFIENLRPILPFEAYMTTSSGNAKRAIPIFEELPTAIREIPLTGFEGEKELRIYATTGNLVLFSETLTLQEALKRLPRGVYIINGKKMAVK